MDQTQTIVFLKKKHNQKQQSNILIEIINRCLAQPSQPHQPCDMPTSLFTQMCQEINNSGVGTPALSCSFIPEFADADYYHLAHHVTARLGDYLTFKLFMSLLTNGSQALVSHGWVDIKSFNNDCFKEQLSKLFQRYVDERYHNRISLLGGKLLDATDFKKYFIYCIIKSTLGGGIDWRDFIVRFIPAVKCKINRIFNMTRCTSPTCFMEDESSRVFLEKLQYAIKVLSNYGWPIENKKTRHEIKGLVKGLVFQATISICLKKMSDHMGFLIPLLQIQTRGDSRFAPILIQLLRARPGMGLKHRIDQMALPNVLAKQHDDSGTVYHEEMKRIIEGLIDMNWGLGEVDPKIMHAIFTIVFICQRWGFTLDGINKTQLKKYIGYLVTRLISLISYYNYEKSSGGRRRQAHTSLSTDKYYKNLTCLIYCLLAPFSGLDPSAAMAAGDNDSSLMAAVDNELSLAGLVRWYCGDTERWNLYLTHTLDRYELGADSTLGVLFQALLCHHGKVRDQLLEEPHRHMFACMKDSKNAHETVCSQYPELFELIWKDILIVDLKLVCKDFLREILAQLFLNLEQQGVNFRFVKKIMPDQSGNFHFNTMRLPPEIIRTVFEFLGCFIVPQNKRVPAPRLGASINSLFLLPYSDSDTESQKRQRVENGHQPSLLDHTDVETNPTNQNLI